MQDFWELSSTEETSGFRNCYSKASFVALAVLELCFDCSRLSVSIELSLLLCSPREELSSKELLLPSSCVRGALGGFGEASFCTLARLILKMTSFGPGLR